MANEVDWAYIAGFLDGDGAIMISRGHNKWSSPIHQPINYAPSLGFSNSNKDVLERIAQTIGGGKVHETTNHQQNPKWRHHYYLDTWSRSIMLPLIKNMLPYLHIKKRQAELAIEFFEKLSPKSGYRCSEEQLKRREVLYYEMRLLNKRGYDTQRDDPTEYEEQVA